MEALGVSSLKSRRLAALAAIARAIGLSQREGLRSSPLLDELRKLDRGKDSPE
jgi:hypothetical protein